MAQKALEGSKKIWEGKKEINGGRVEAWEKEKGSTRQVCPTKDTLVNG